MKISGIATAVATALFMAGAAHAATTAVKIVAFNDFHGNMQSPGAANGASAAGGVDVMAAYVNRLKQQNPATIVVSAGDLIGASPLISALFHDEGTIETMNRLGLDFNAVGNHEFDDGRVELLRMQNGGCHPTDANTCQGSLVGTPVPFEGAKFKFLSANVVDSATGQTLFAPYGIKVVNGVRVGFIGLTLKDTPTIVTPSGVAGLTFLDEVQTINAAVPKLRARGVETIIVLLHQGGASGGLNTCSAGTGGAVGAIVRGLDNAVDAVISGHSHSLFNCTLPNSAGRNIPVTQASSAGKILTDLNLTIDTTTGDVIAAVASNIVVDRNAAGIVPDATIAGIVNGYSNLVAPLANAVVGSVAASTPGGNFIADSQWAATSAAQFGGAEFAMMNPGGVRSPGSFGTPPYPHDVTYAEAFTIQPFGNSLVTMTLTNQQIRNVLEQQFRNCLGQTAGAILNVSSGMHYTYRNGNACGQRIVDGTINGVSFVSNGVVLDPTATHRVTVNNFLATGGDGFTALTAGTNLLGGAQDIDAAVAYFSNFKAPNPPFDPSTLGTRVQRLD